MKKAISITLTVAMCVSMFSALVNFRKVSAATQDYDRALDYAIQFFDANRCGQDAATNNVFSWRGACHTSDKGSNGEDLTGGFHDAGDHVKFGYPQAYSAAMLGWAMYEYKTVIAETGNKEKLLSTLKYFTDYLLKCHPDTNTFYHQVGEGGSDHSYWGPPENQTDSRGVKVINSSQAGTDVCGATSAALSIMYLNYKEIDVTYANKCLSAAKSLLALAKSQVGAYNEYEYYKSNAYDDDIAWASLWLYIAGDGTDSSLLSDAETYSTKPKLNGEDPLKHMWTMCWDDVYLPTYIKLAQITDKSIYKDALNYSFNYWKTGVNKTPGGLMYLNNWGALRYASAEAALAFMYNNLVEKDAGLVSSFKTQIDYALGSNPSNMSYVIGYGSNWPKSPHHRAANPDKSSNAKYTLTGALVGGPGNNDVYVDDVNQYQYSEVAIDYNASFMLSLTSYLATTMNISIVKPPKNNSTVTPPPTSGDIKYGDLDGNNNVDSLDFGLMRMHILGMETLSDNALKAADVNNDGQVNSLDFGVLRQYLLGIVTSLPV